MEFWAGLRKSVDGKLLQRGWAGLMSGTSLLQNTPPCCSAAVLQYPARAPRTLASRRSCGGPALGEQWPIHRPQICEHPYKPLIFLYRSSSSHFVSKVATAKCVKQVKIFKSLSLCMWHWHYVLGLPTVNTRRHKSCKLNIIINQKWTSRVSRGAGAGPGLFQELHSFV